MNIPLLMLRKERDVYNLSHIAFWKSGLAAAAAAGVVPIVIMGDSIGEGYNTTAFLTDGFVAKLRVGLQARYGGASGGILTCWRRTDAVPATAWTYSGAITDSTFYYQLAYGVTGTVTITGTGFEFIYLKGSAVGRFTITVDGGAPAETNAYAASTAIGSVIVGSLANTTHTIVVTSSESPKKLLFFGIIPTTGNGIVVDNHARTGWTNYEYGQTWAQNLATWVQPQLTIIALTANEYASQTALDTYTTRVNAVVDYLLAANSKVILFANGLRQAVAGSITQKQYADTLLSIASAKKVTLINWNGKFHHSYAEGVSRGMIDVGQVVHPNNAGHIDMANMLLRYLT